MTTKAASRKDLVVAVLLGLAFLLIVVMGWRSFGGTLPLEPKGYRVEVPLSDARNISGGADVTMSGVRIGDVVKVGTDRLQPVATIEIDAEFAPLRTGTSAIARTKSLLGEPYIELAPGSPSAPVFTDGARLPASQVRPAQTLDEVLGALSPRARRDFGRLVDGMARAFGGRAGDVSGALAEGAGTADAFSDVAAELDRQRPALSDLIARSGDVFAAVGAREGALQSAIRATDSVLATTAERDDALRATVARLPRFLQSLTAASEEIARASGDLGAAASALRSPARRAAPVLRGLARTTPPFERAFEAATPALRSAERGLPALDGVIRGYGDAATQVHPALREVVPVAQLLTEVKGSLVSFFANVASMVNGRLDIGGGQTGHALSAMPSFWNETFGGWVKKLPTSRPNPYPRPGSAENIARGGLRSFDCRHTGNPNYIPATGSGAPPCLVQGPWEFQGVTAYYPRLQRAAP